MRRLLAVLALAALPTASTQMGCGSTEPHCAQAGQSCMTMDCCSMLRDVEYTETNGVRTMVSCTCN